MKHIYRPCERKNCKVLRKCSFSEQRTRLRGSSRRRTSSRLVSHFGRFNSTFRWESERSLTLHISKSGDILCSDPLMLETCPCIKRLRHVSSQGCDTCPQPLLAGSRTPGAPKMRVLPIAKLLSRMHRIIPYCIQRRYMSNKVDAEHIFIS